MATIHKRARISANLDAIVDFEGNDVLIDDVIIKIIQNVPIAQWRQLESISKQFQRCIKTAYRSVLSLNLKNVFLAKFGVYSVKQDDLLQFLKKLTEYCPHLHMITGFDCFMDDIKNDCKLTNRHLELLQHLTELKSISFKNCYMRISDLSRCLKHFPDLKMLEIHDCSFWPNLFRDSFDQRMGCFEFRFFDQFSGLVELSITGFMVQFAGSFLSMINADHLKVLNFSESKFDGTYVSKLLNRCVNLEAVYLFDPVTCYHAYRVGLELEVLQCLPKLQKLCKFHLNISAIADGDYFLLENYTASDLLNVLVKCKCLSDISLKCDGELEFNDHILQNLVNGCSQLVSLHLDVRMSSSYGSLSMLTDLQNLTSLTLHNYNKNDVLKDLCLKLDKLDHLSCLAIYAADFGEAELSSLKRLEHITSFTFRPNYQFGYNMDHRPVTEMVARNWIETGFLKRLTMLKLISHITNSVVNLIVENAAVLNVFCFCGEINDNTLLSISENCKFLKMLDIERCSGMSEKGLLVFLANSSLRGLIISRYKFKPSIQKNVLFQPYKHVIWFDADDYIF